MKKRRKCNENEVSVGGVIYDREYIRGIFAKHTTRELLEIVPGISSLSTVRHVAKRLGIRTKPAPEAHNPRGINGGSKSDTICWECANATDQSKCCWVKDYTPVEGWDATPRRIRYNGSIVDSYMVRACPNFKEG